MSENVSLLKKTDSTASLDKTLYFSQGLLGFENLKEFSLLPLDIDGFYLLQAKEEELSWLLIEPWPFFPDYQVEISLIEAKRLDLKEPQQSLILVLVTIMDNDFARASANLLGPVIINQESGQALQVVLGNTAYTTRHLLFPQGKEPD